MKTLITPTLSLYIYTIGLLLGGALASPALHAAAVRGDNDAVLAELQNGADVNVVDGRQLTALHAASHAKQEEAVRTLLRHGASTQLKDGRGLSVLHLAALGGSEGVQIQMYCLSLGWQTLAGGPGTSLPVDRYSHNLKAPLGVMSALLEHGADASATEPNRGATALHLAATNPQARGAAAALLAHGADAWAKDKAGDTPTDRHHECVAEARTTRVSRAAEAGVASAVEADADAAAAASAPAPEGSTAEAGGSGDETPAAALLLLPDIDPAARRGDALRRADWTGIGTGHFTEGKHELAAQHLYVASQVLG